MGAGASADRKIAIKVRVRRYDPERRPEGWWDEWDLEMGPMDRLLDALNEIKWHHDGTLGMRRSCAHGICGSDAMMVNGKNALACKVMVKDVAPKVTVEPIRGLPLIKDLIVDMDPFIEAYKSVMPFLVNDTEPPDSERLQTPKEHSKYEDTTKCILCACCTTSCPIFWGDDGYFGPAAIVNAHRFIMDSRDEAGRERLHILSGKSGAFRCRTTFNCTEACPREIKVTRAIQEVKRAVMFDHF